MQIYVKYTCEKMRLNRDHKKACVPKLVAYKIVTPKPKAFGEQ